MRMTLVVHIIAGGLRLLSGYVALAAAKGGTLHRKSGILFVYVMVAMAITGMLVSAVEGVAPAINVPSALLTFYLLPIFATFYWLWRIRVRRSVRGIVRKCT